jgi:hypothetical protein
MMEIVQLTNSQWVWEIFCILAALVIIFLVLCPKD